jgi:RHS repeat-associated protein
MLQPDRSYSLGSYRYGFNGKENDNEVKGEGNQQDYGMRVYDPRLGKFLSVDPLMKEYPWNSTYSFAENSPILNIDLDGLEKASVNKPLPNYAFIPLAPITSEGIKRILVESAKQAVKSPTIKKVVSSASMRFAASAGRSGGLTLALTLLPANYDDKGSDIKPEYPPLERVTTDPEGDLSYGEKKALRDRMYLGTASENDKVQYGIIMDKFHGSGPASGVLSLSNESKSGKAVSNYYPSSGYIEFVFDAEKEVFAVGRPNGGRLVLGLSGHQKLNTLIGGDPSKVVGGMFSREKDGSITLNDYSGHFYQNWTLEKADKLKTFLESKTGKPVNIIFTFKIPPAK